MPHDSIVSFYTAYNRPSEQRGHGDISRWISRGAQTLWRLQYAGQLRPDCRRHGRCGHHREKSGRNAPRITRSTALKRRWQNRADRCAYQHREQTIAVLISVESTRSINQKTTPKGRGFLFGRKWTACVHYPGESSRLKLSYGMKSYPRPSSSLYSIFPIMILRFLGPSNILRLIRRLISGMISSSSTTKIIAIS